MQVHGYWQPLAPGPIYACRDADVAGPGLSASLHELGLLSALRFIAQDKRPEIYVSGREPETTDYGLDLTPAVKAALPRYIQIVRETVDRRRLGR